MKHELYVVTGASSGIGAEIARALATEGYRVFLSGRNEQRLLRLQAELTGSIAFPCDLQKSGDIERLVLAVTATVEKENLKLKGLVNNAGIVARDAFAHASLEDWRTQFETNLFAPVQLTRALYPLLKQAAPSSVLNIASTLGLRPIAETSAYSASKAAMINWSQTLAIEWAKHLIRVNCLCPGLVDTPIHPFHGESDDHLQRKAAHSIQPLRRMGKPEDIASAASFLLSEEKSPWTTGAVWNVDGGVLLV
jgi:NAD(P)-dependent dehydrogenase (short-subunit alcohol dehydrogenase family)